MPAGSARDPRREGLRGPQRVSGQPLHQRRHLHQPRHERALHLHLSRRILRLQLRAHAGGADPAPQHGRASRHLGLPAHHPQ